MSLRPCWASRSGGSTHTCLSATHTVATGPSKGSAAFDALLARLAARDRLPPVTQTRASSCVAAGLTDRVNAVCIGHLLYGLSPFADASLADLSAYRPVLAEIGSRLIQVSDHPQGSDIAIGGTHGLRQGRRTGVAPIGVAQGLVRPVPGSLSEALVRGRRAPILAVSLEHLVLDLGDIGDAATGDVVRLLGGEDDASIGLDELAAWFGMTALDTVMVLSGRLAAHHRDAAGGVAGWTPLRGGAR